MAKENTKSDNKRIREYGIEPGILSPGEKNSITDVSDVEVGHKKITKGDPNGSNDCVRTGVSVVGINDRNLYKNPATASAYVYNGYGKSVGIPQVNELGQLETQIGLTNTLDVWTVAESIVGDALEENPDVKSVNPLVGECNDGKLSDIRGRHVSQDDVHAAMGSLSKQSVSEGCVGAGCGTVGFGWKAGIGTSSREVYDSVVGAFVLTNTGKPDDLRIDGMPVNRFVDTSEAEEAPDSGSIIMIIGTDADLTHRQLHRCTKRSVVGLGRVGGIAHHGSGDFAFGFSTGTNKKYEDSELTRFFRGSAEAVEEAIYNSLSCAETTEGINGNTVKKLPEEVIKKVSEVY